MSYLLPPDLPHRSSSCIRRRAILLPLVGNYTKLITQRDAAAFTLTKMGYKVSMAVGTWLIQFGSDGYFTALSGNYVAPVIYVETIPNQAVNVPSVWNGLLLASALPEILW